jgi:hypothetical protein
MYLEKWVDGQRFKIVVRLEAEQRLSQTCFRGAHCRCAGNFFRFESAIAVFNCEEVWRPFSEEILEMWEKNDFGFSSFSILCDRPVGWSSTMPIESVGLEGCEQFNPNRRSSGLRVKINRRNIMAPTTSIITFVVEFRSEDNVPAVVIHSMYPGVDIGKLVGNVTEREGVVFFDWNHPGEFTAHLACV